MNHHQRISTTMVKKAMRADRRLEISMVERLVELTLPTGFTQDERDAAKTAFHARPIQEISDKLVAAEAELAHRIGRAARKQPAKIFAQAIADIARLAGNHLNRYYQAHALSAGKKWDVPFRETDMNIEAGKIIFSGLKGLQKTPVIISPNYSGLNLKPAQGKKFWLVNALDINTTEGLRDFAAGNPDFTVSIAIIHDRKPVFGVVYAPAHNRLYTGIPGDKIATVHTGTRRHKISVQPTIGDKRTMLATPTADKRAVSAFKKAHKIRHVRKGTSIALNFCRLAEGSKGGVDFNPVFTPAKEWELAASHAVILAAGGTIVDFTKEPLIYANRGGQFVIQPSIGAAKFQLLRA